MLLVVIMEPDAASNPCNATLKITDFDQVLKHDETAVMPGGGTYAWMAPEVIMDSTFSKAGDVWR